MKLVPLTISSAKTALSRDDERLSMALLILLGSLFITNASYVLSTLIDFNYDQLSKIIKAMPVIAVVSVLPVLFRVKYSKPLISVIVILLFLYAWSGINVFSKEYKEYFRYFITVCLPCMIIAYAIKDYHYFFEKLKYVSVFFAFISFAILLISKSVDSESDYYMAYSYSSSIFTIALFSDVDVKRKWRIPVLLGKMAFIVSIVLLGARGPLLTIALFIVSKNISSPKRSFGYKTVFLCAFGILLLLHSTVFSFLNDLALSHGITSRTLMSLSGQDVSLSGRGNYYAFYLNEILSDPIAFRGIASDWDYMGYPHNIFIELWYQLGAIGFIASIVIIISIVHIWFFKKYQNCFTQVCDIFFLAIGVYILLLSNSLWKTLQFWVWLGYMLRPQRSGDNNEGSRNQLLQLRQHRYNHASNC